tara:strand:+ start:1121 stop:1258 length:138 start_codon:yes stop_codon:yes gene_type:complete
MIKVVKCVRVKTIHVCLQKCLHHEYVTMLIHLPVKTSAKFKELLD